MVERYIDKRGARSSSQTMKQANWSVVRFLDELDALTKAED